MDIVTLGAALNGSKAYTDQVTQSLAGSDIGLAGYTKGTVAKQDVSPADNVNQGLGKIEKRVSDNENNISLKANVSDVNTATTNLQTQIDQIAQAAGTGSADTEVAQARVGADGTSYQTLKARLDGENSKLKEDLSVFEVGIDITETPGYWNASGNISTPSTTNQEVYTNNISAYRYGAIHISLHYSESRSAWLACGVFKKDGTFERVVLINEACQEKTVKLAFDSNTAYVSICYRTYGETDTVNVTAFMAQKDIDIEDLQIDILKNKQFLKNIYEKSGRGLGDIPTSLVTKYTDKKWVFPKGVSLSDLVGVSAYEITVDSVYDYLIKGKYMGDADAYAVYYFDENMTLISEKHDGIATDVNGYKRLVVPANCKTIRYTARTNAGDAEGQFYDSIKTLESNYIEKVSVSSENIFSELYNCLAMDVLSIPESNITTYTGKCWDYNSGGNTLRNSTNATAFEISVNPFDYVVLSGKYIGAGMNYNIYLKTSDNTTIKIINGISALEYRLLVPHNCEKIRFTCRTEAEDPVPSAKYAKISGLKESVTTELSELALYPGYYNGNGTIENQTSDKEMYSLPVDVYTNSISLDITFENPHNLWVAIAEYTKNGEFIVRQTKLQNNTNSLHWDITLSDNAYSVGFSFRTFNENYVVKIHPQSVRIMDGLKDVKTDISAISQRPQIGNYALRFGSMYDHLFVSRSNQWCTIPHESVYHVRLSRRMGFNTIEANVTATSDGVNIVNHFSSSKFGGWFHHVDGETDISDISVKNVTWDWVCQNVRYNSNIPKYRTRPCRLEEFLQECRQQNITPFIQSNDVNVLKLAEQYMGVDNYIAYGATRKTCPNGIIYHWVTRNTKEDILDYCEKIGTPFIYGMANPTSFTDEELREIIDALHEKGFYIGTSYLDTKWHKYSAMGFDANGTQTRINRINTGNLYNFSSMLNYNDFTVVGATESDGILTFGDIDGTISPNVSNDVYDVCGIDLQVSFVGEITIPSKGEMTQVATYTSDGSYPLFVSAPIIDGGVAITLYVKAGTVINDITFKASKF